MTRSRNAEEAQSQTIKDAVWDWYRSGSPKLAYIQAEQSF